MSKWNGWRCIGFLSRGHRLCGNDRFDVHRWVPICGVMQRTIWCTQHTSLIALPITDVLKAMIWVRCMCCCLYCWAFWRLFASFILHGFRRRSCRLRRKGRREIRCCMHNRLFVGNIWFDDFALFFCFGWLTVELGSMIWGNFLLFWKR